MPKSRPNNPRLLSILDYIFFNLFWVVHRGKQSYFGLERHYSDQNCVFLEVFLRVLSGCRRYPISHSANIAIRLYNTLFTTHSLRPTCSTTCLTNACKEPCFRGKQERIKGIEKASRIHTLSHR